MAQATEEEPLGDSSESSLEWRSLSQGHLPGNNVASSAAPSMLMMHGAQLVRKEVRVSLVRRWVAIRRQRSVGRPSHHRLCRRTRAPKTSYWPGEARSCCWCGSGGRWYTARGWSTRPYCRVWVALTMGVVCLIRGRRCLVMMGLSKAPGPPHRTAHRRT
jgi:hypothetical protein